MDYDGRPCNESISTNCNYTALVEVMVRFHGSEGGLNPGCVAAKPADQVYSCMIAEHAIGYVAHDVFFEQSKFDHWQLWQEAGIPCVTQQAYTPPWQPAPTCSAADSAAIAGYGKTFMAQASGPLNETGAHRGFFLTSCLVHGQDWHYASIDHVSLQSAFATWYYRRHAERTHVTNDFRWVEDQELPRTDNPLACPPFVFTPWN